MQFPIASVSAAMSPTGLEEYNGGLIPGRESRDSDYHNSGKTSFLLD
jgi:hypothetical protein